MTRTSSPTSSIDTASYELLGVSRTTTLLQCRRAKRPACPSSHPAQTPYPWRDIGSSCSRSGCLRRRRWSPATSRRPHPKRFRRVCPCKTGRRNPRLCWADRACSADCSDRNRCQPLRSVPSPVRPRASAAPFPSKQAFFSSQPPLPAVCLRGISFSAIKTNQRRTFFLFFEKKRDSFHKFHFTSILP